jgi:peptide/nickel transport system substrate-binding protein
MTRTKLRDALLAAAILLLTASCGRESGPQDTGDGTPEDGGVAVIAEIADINQPIAFLANTQLDGDLGADVMNMSLLRGVWENGALGFQTAEETPVALARSFEYFGPDSAAVRFHMRSDAKWSDGVPITAADIVFTFGLIKNPAVASPLQGYAELMDSVVAENDSTISFHFKHRYPDMLSHASVPPLPRHIYQDASPADIRNHPTILDPSGGKLVTSGPWMIGEWRKGQQITLVHNPHFRPQPHLDRIVVRIIPEPTTRIVELQTGAVDMVRGVSSDQLPMLRAAEGIRIEREQKRVYDYIAYNGKQFPPFADRDIRHALTLAIDPNALIQALHLEDVAVAAGGPLPPIYGIYNPQQMPPVKLDTLEARRILTSKGWVDSDGDGILDKDGKPFQFTLLTGAGNPRRSDATVIVQQNWRKIGVDAQLQQLEANTFNRGRLFAHQFQAAAGTWSVGLTPDFLSILYGTGQEYNVNEYSNPRVDTLFAQAGRQPTEAAAGAFWAEAAGIIAHDQPYSWLYYFDTIDPVRDRLKGVHIDTFGAYQNTWEWWIPRSQQRGAPAAARDSAQ